VRVAERGSARGAAACALLRCRRMRSVRFSQFDFRGPSQEARAKRRFWTLGRGRAGACGRQSASVGGGYGCTSAGGKPGQRQIQGTKGTGLAPRASDENPRREPLGNSPVILSFTFLLLDGNYNSKNCEVKTIGKICREICRRVIV
jgi:hypothetical protein